MNILKTGALNIASFGNFLSTFGWTAIAIVIVVIAFYVTFYCFQCISIMKIAKRHNIKHNWLAWIPIANAYIYGKIAFEETWKAVVLFVLKAAPLLLTFLFIFDNKPNLLIQILSAVYVVLLFLATYKIYKQMSDKSTVMLIFSILSFGTLIPVFLFAIRNNPIKMEN